MLVSSTLFTVELQSIDHVEVGRPHEISCTLNTGKTLNHTELDISWTGPNGVIMNDSSRITVIPATSDGHTHTSTLQFSYLSEEDENTSYSCMASLFGEQESLFKSLTMINIASKSLACYSYLFTYVVAILCHYTCMY